MCAKIKNRGNITHKHAHTPKGVSHHSFRKVYWPYIPLLAVIALLASIGLKSGAVTHGLRHPGSQVLAYSTSMQSRKLLADTNLDREQNHSNDLQLNDRLSAAAQAKANDMAKRNYWSHTTPEGLAPWAFFSGQNYQYQKAGENLAAGFDNEQSVVNAWMASPGHRHNLLDPAYSDVGFGVANIANYSAAGGGSMTVVVAFYGEPATGFDTPTTIENSGGSAYTSANKLVVKADQTQKTSLAQVALAQLHFYKYTSIGLAAVIILAFGLWISRHALLLHRVIVKGEKLVFNRPILDIGLLVVGALAFLLNQTAGFIR